MKQIAVPFALSILALVVGAFGLGAQPLWNDEAFSFFVAYKDVEHTLAFMRQDTQPPFYYLVLTGCLRFGHDPWVLRSLSVAAIVLAVPLLYDAGRRLLDAPTAALGTLLFLLNANVLIWEQRARPYALQAGLVALAFWGFTRIWTSRPRPPAIAWLAWILGGALALITQYPAGFFLLGAHVAMAFRLLPHPRENAGAIMRWTLAQLAMFLLWGPWIPAFFVQFGAHLTPEQMVHNRNFLIGREDFIAGLRGLLSIPTLWRAQWPFVAAYAGLACLGAVALWRRGVAWPILGTCAVPLAVCIAGFAAVHPVLGYVTLNFVWLLLPYSLLIAAGITALPRKAAIAAGIVLLAGNIMGIRNVYTSHSVPLDQVARAVGVQMAPGDGMILSQTAATRWAMAYYLGPPYAGQLVGLDVADMPAAGWPLVSVEQTKALSRLWLIIPDGEEPMLDPNSLTATFATAWTQRFAGVSVARLDRRAEAGKAVHE